MLQILALCNEAGVEGEGQLTGSPTEQALFDLVRRCGLDPDEVRRAHPFLEMHQRAEGRPLLSTLHHGADEQRLVAVKGSPGALLERCDWLLEPGRALAKADRDAILSLNEQLSGIQEA
ncbi:hypothetical protein [Thiocystis minor]|uniref:hypothetical protein n=1 Tax=Thiocystis minor TaxID=61597 RepID=UPI0019129D43|nr:hypothetical protein [Thiocystis minor]